MVWSIATLASIFTIEYLISRYIILLPFYFAYNIPDPMGYNTYLIFYRVLPRHCLSCLQLSAEIRVRLSTRRKSRDIDIPGLVIAHRSHPSPRSPLNGNLAEMLPVFCRLSVTSGVTCVLSLQYVGLSKQKSPSNDFLMISRGKPSIFSLYRRYQHI